MKYRNLTTSQQTASNACYCYSGYFNTDDTNAGDNFYIRIRSVENAQKDESTYSDFVTDFGSQVYSIKDDLISVIFGELGTEEDMFFYSALLWEDDGARAEHVIVHCLKKPIISIDELQRFVATTLAKKYSLVAGATLTAQMNPAVLEGFAKSLKQFNVTQ